MESRMEEYLNAAISGNTENLPQPISRIDFLLCELIKTLGESGASIEEVEKIVTNKVAEIVADAPEDFDTLKELSDWIYTHEESAATMNTAIQTNANSIESLMTDVNKKANSDNVYDKATADSKFLGIDATAVKAVADENGSNISETFSAVKNDIALNRTTLGTQCKNLLKNTAVTTTINGVTFTVNSDGSITATQTTTSSANATIKVATMTLKPGTYILTGDDEIRLSGFGAIRFYVGSTIYSSNKPHTFDTEVTIDVRLFVWQGVNINGSKTIYPMLRYADITDDTYEPYKESVDERLIKNKSDIAINKTTLGYTTKNLLKIATTIKSGNGVTITVNDDKSITVNGTATSAGVYAAIGEADVIAGNKYIFNGGAGSSTTYGLYTENFGTVHNFGSDNVYIPNATGKAVFRVFVRPNVTISNVTFKPMLRDVDITDDTYEEYHETVDERLIKNKSDIAINKTTLGYQCKNLHDTLSVNWYQPGKTSVASDGTVTTTITSDSRSFTYANSEHYITLEAGNYIITANTLEFAAGSSALIRGCNSDNQSLFSLSVSSAGLHKAAFSLSEKTTIGIMYKLYSQTCTIMIRDADILDDTYEPYQPSVQEQIAALEARIAALEV